MSNVIASEKSSPPLSHQSLLDQASALAPVLRDRAQDTTDARRIGESTIADFWQAGLFNLLKPRECGGQELPLDIVLRITGILARGDGSAAWVWNSFILHEWVAALLPHEAQQDFWAKEYSLAASSFAANGKLTPTNDGFKLSGKWSFCSGVDCADWIFLGAKCVMPDADPKKPDIRWILVPKSDCRVIDDWHVLGLRGTGSKSVAVHNAWVPQHRTMRYDDLVEGLSPGGKIHANPLYRAPVWTIFPLGICAPAVGIAQGACESFMREFRTRVYGIDYQPQAKNPAVQLRLAEASALIDAADLLYQRSLTDIVEKTAAAEPLSIEDRVRSRRDQGYAVQMCTRAVELLLAAQGGKGLYNASPIQRALCDLHALGAHIMGGWDMPALNFGQVMLSGTPANPFY